MRLSKPVRAAGSWLVVCALAVCGQSVVEHSLATAAGAAGAAAGKGAGKSIGGVFDKLAKTLDSAAKPASQTATRNSKPVTTATDIVPAKEPAAAREFPDPQGITVGLEREELIRKFGEPSMKTTDVRDAQLVETCWYTPAKFGAVVVTLRDGKVTAVAPQSPPKPQNPAVVVLQ
jgi:hypothetical protein